MADTTPNPQSKSSAGLYQPCVECKRKRTICVRVRRKINMGHALISVHEPLESGGTATTTYGLWPKQDGAASGASDLRVNDPGDAYWKDTNAWDPKDVKCKEMDEKDEEALKKAVNKNEQYSFTSGNWCSTWAAGTYNGVTGSNYGGFTPAKLGNQIRSPY
jgi:hypothetical protein